MKVLRLLLLVILDFAVVVAFSCCKIVNSSHFNPCGACVERGLMPHCPKDYFSYEALNVHLYRPGVCMVCAYFLDSLHFCEATFLTFLLLDGQEKL